MRSFTTFAAVSLFLSTVLSLPLVQDPTSDPSVSFVARRFDPTAIKAASADIPFNFSQSESDQSGLTKGLRFKAGSGNPVVKSLFGRANSLVRKAVAPIQEQNQPRSETGKVPFASQVEAIDSKRPDIPRKPLGQEGQQFAAVEEKPLVKDVHGKRQTDTSLTDTKTTEYTTGGPAVSSGGADVVSKEAAPPVDPTTTEAFFESGGQMPEDPCKKKGLRWGMQSGNRAVMENLGKRDTVCPPPQQ
ncbi:MAG: hypothetical protein Q9213_000730 [Squamulea squamosa]